MQDKDQIKQDWSASEQAKQSPPQLHKDSLKAECTLWLYNLPWVKPHAYSHRTAIQPG